MDETVTLTLSSGAAYNLDAAKKAATLKLIDNDPAATQDALRSTYTWVPQQSWNRTWTDGLLYTKYGITKNEIAFIESMIRPMGEGDE